MSLAEKLVPDKNKYRRLPVLVPPLCTAPSHLPPPTSGSPIPRRHVVVLGLHTPRVGAVRPVREPPPPPLGSQNVAAPAGRLPERMALRRVYKITCISLLQNYTQTHVQCACMMYGECDKEVAVCDEIRKK